LRYPADSAVGIAVLIGRTKEKPLLPVMRKMARKNTLGCTALSFAVTIPVSVILRPDRKSAPYTAYRLMWSATDL
jgi:hypothetical protein